MRPFPSSINNSPASRVGTFAPKGQDLRTLPQLLDLNSALYIENYWIEGNGRLVKRGGSNTVFEHGSDTGGTKAAFKYNDRYLVWSYGTTLAVYDLTLDSNTEVKTDFSAQITSAVRYGAYGVVGNGVDKLWRLSLTLAYDGQTANFTVGEKVTGGTSGATAIVMEDADAGATGTLTLGDISGIFLNNEAITGDTTGIAVVNGTLTWVATEISASPRAKFINVRGARLDAANVKGDSSAYYYSASDTGSGAPFSDWTVGTDADDAGVLRANSPITGVNNVGKDIGVAFCEEQRFAFQTTSSDVGGTLTKVDNVVWDEKGRGGLGRSEMTEYGLVYTDNQGVRYLVSVGQEDIKYSSQEILLSWGLSQRYIEQFDFTDSFIFYDNKRDLIYVSCRKNSDTNNAFLVYHPQKGMQGFTEFTGLSIGVMVEVNGTIYGFTSSGTKIVEMFNFYGDDEQPIATTFYQEVNFKNLFTRGNLNHIYAQGWLHDSSEITICFDKYDLTGAVAQAYKCLVWSGEDAGGGGGGFGGGFGEEGFGDGFADDITIQEYSNLSPSFKERQIIINRFQRLRIKFTSLDVYPHVLNWFSLMMDEGAPIRLGNLTQL